MNHNNLVTILFCFLSVFSFGQDQNNLVPNSSFESLDGKLKKLKQIITAKDWNSPTALNADLFSTTKEGAIGAPVNIYGKEHPKDGDNYAGIVAYSHNNKTTRTYVQAPLINQLRGRLLCEIHVSLMI